MYKFGDNISWQVLDGNMYITDERDSGQFVLNNLSTMICLALTKGESVEMIAKKTAEEYSADEYRVLDEIKKLIDDLLKASIFTEVRNE